MPTSALPWPTGTCPSAIKSRRTSRPSVMSDFAHVEGDDILAPRRNISYDAAWLRRYRWPGASPTFSRSNHRQHWSPFTPARSSQHRLVVCGGLGVATGRPTDSSTRARRLRRLLAGRRSSSSAARFRANSPESMRWHNHTRIAKPLRIAPAVATSGVEQLIASTAGSEKLVQRRHARHLRRGDNPGEFGVLQAGDDVHPVPDGQRRQHLADGPSGRVWTPASRDHVRHRVWRRPQADTTPLSGASALATHTIRRTLARRGIGGEHVGVDERDGGDRTPCRRRRPCGYRPHCCARPSGEFGYAWAARPRIARECHRHAEIFLSPLAALTASARSRVIGRMDRGDQREPVRWMSSRP